MDTNVKQYEIIGMDFSKDGNTSVSVKYVLYDEYAALERKYKALVQAVFESAIYGSITDRAKELEEKCDDY